MAFTQIDALRISPRFTASDWQALDRTNPCHWRHTSQMVKDRLDGRFLRYAGNCLRSPHSGFVVLAIDCLLLETIQQFREGIIYGRGQSRRLVIDFLKGQRFQPLFDKEARSAFYQDVRCGLFHQAEARRKWLIRRNQASMLAPFPAGDGYIIDAPTFHKNVALSLSDYLAEIQAPDNEIMRDNLWVKMDQLCDVRNQRGALDEEAKV